MRNANLYGNRTTKAESIASIKHLLVKSRRIGNNTFKVFYKNGDHAIRLHKTDIITWRANKVILNTNGWQTLTSKARMNEYLPTFKGVRVYQSKHIWYVNTPEGAVEYYDGIELDYDGCHSPYCKNTKTTGA